MKAQIIESDSIAATLEELLARSEFSSLFVLTDSNVARHVLPLLAPVLSRFNARVLITPAGEQNKNLDALADIWRQLSDGGATRRSLLINLGGGMVTDLGGFAAATFKRGIRFVNIPTTVLGAVDASVGGKTGIDFNGLKNEVGAFALPEAVIISGEPLATLPDREILSGFGEMVKTALISSSSLYSAILADDIFDNPTPFRAAMSECVRFKEEITNEDLREGGLRKILNFGHTAGHAFETMAWRRNAPVSHGEAVANGILVALILSHTLLSLPSAHIHTYKDRILRRYFRPVPILCKEYDEFLEIVGHDKKNNASDTFNFVLLEEIASPLPSVAVSPKDLLTALDIYRDFSN